MALAALVKTKRKLKLEIRSHPFSGWQRACERALSLLSYRRYDSIWTYVDGIEVVAELAAENKVTAVNIESTFIDLGTPCRGSGARLLLPTR